MNPFSAIRRTILNMQNRVERDIGIEESVNIYLHFDMYAADYFNECHDQDEADERAFRRCEREAK